MSYLRPRVVFFFVICIVLASPIVLAENISGVGIRTVSNEIIVNWTASGERWRAKVKKDTYFGEYVPLIEVSVTTGDENLISLLPNCYFRGSLINADGSEIVDTAVFLDFCDSSIPFVGFVAAGVDLYLIEKDDFSLSGISMNLELPNSASQGSDEVEAAGNGWKEGGSGGALTPNNIYSRGNSSETFPSLDIYVNPSFVVQVGESNYVSRITQSLAAANIIYQQSELKQIHLSAIVLADQDMSTTDSQGNLLHAMEKIRKYTVQADSSDASIVLTGGEFKMPYLWGWSELGFACDLEQAVANVNDINTHNVGKAAAAIIDRPTLIQRAWILGHEMGHILGMVHVYRDPLAYGTFQPKLALKDYVARCYARSTMYESCAFDAQTQKFTDFYSCN